MHTDSPPQLLEIPSTTTILILLAVAFILSYISVSFSLTVSFQSALLRAQVAACSSRLAASISRLASFLRPATFTSKYTISRSELASLRSELVLLTSEIADLRREWLDLNNRNQSLEREVAGINPLLGRPRDVKSSISVQQEEGYVEIANRED